MESLSVKDRLNLMLQFQILHHLAPDDGWEKFVEVLRRGYTSHYRDILQMIGPELSESESSFVEDVLSMFDALQWPLVKNGSALPNEALLPGFDGNNDGALLGYARFLRSEGRWESVQAATPDLNSHFPTRDVYWRMLAVWKEAGSPHEIDADLHIKVIEARIHPDNRLG